MILVTCGGSCLFTTPLPFYHEISLGLMFWSKLRSPDEACVLEPIPRRPTVALPPTQRPLPHLLAPGAVIQTVVVPHSLSILRDFRPLVSGARPCTGRGTVKLYSYKPSARRRQLQPPERRNGGPGDLQCNVEHDNRSTTSQGSAPPGILTRKNEALILR